MQQFIEHISLKTSRNSTEISSNAKWWPKVLVNAQSVLNYVLVEGRSRIERSFFPCLSLLWWQSINESMWLCHMWQTSPLWLFIILEVWTLLAVTCAHNDLAEDHSQQWERECEREREREHATETHKFKSNKTFKTNKCQGIFRGGLRTRRNQNCSKRMYCSSDNKGRINLKARKIFKKKQKKLMKRVAWGIWYNPPQPALHSNSDSSFFMNACVRGERLAVVLKPLLPYLLPLLPPSRLLLHSSYSLCAKVVYLSAVARPWNVLAYDRGVNLCEVSRDRKRGKETWREREAESENPGQL